MPAEQVFQMSAFLKKVSPDAPTVLRIAINIVQTHPDYQFYTNNCQNFVLYLHAFACPEFLTPKTINHAVTDILDDLSWQRDGSGSTVVILVVLFD